jgi:hypothetical protein
MSPNSPGIRQVTGTDLGWLERCHANVRLIWVIIPAGAAKWRAAAARHSAGASPGQAGMAMMISAGMAMMISRAFPAAGDASSARM